MRLLLLSRRGSPTAHEVWTKVAFGLLVYDLQTTSSRDFSRPSLSRQSLFPERQQCLRQANNPRVRMTWQMIYPATPHTNRPQLAWNGLPHSKLSLPTDNCEWM